MEVDSLKHLIHRHKSRSNNKLQQEGNARPYKKFDNQVTLVYHIPIEGVNCLINTKIFKNGNVQMTGIRNIDQGQEMIQKIIIIIQDLYKSGSKEIVTEIQDIRCSDYRLRLINSDFKIGYDIRREQLYQLLVDKYQISCSFEAVIYPAVKIKYYYNDHNLYRNGICNCSKKCSSGKNSGSGDGMCKKITIAVFQSGCIIITGGQSINQVNEAYDFIVRILNENVEVIKKRLILIPVNVKEDAKKILVKINNIKPFKA